MAGTTLGFVDLRLAFGYRSPEGTVSDRVTRTPVLDREVPPPAQLTPRGGMVVAIVVWSVVLLVVAASVFVGR
jgi:hypothetical protein